MLLFFILAWSMIAQYVSSFETVFQPRYFSPLGIPLHAPPIYIPRKIHDTQDLPFKEHDDWLAITLDYELVKPLVGLLNSSAPVPLLSPRDAHITVITPPEFKILASVNITSRELHHIAKTYAIQSCQFSLVCLGKVDLQREGVHHIVYQIIVDAPALLRIREVIFRLFYFRGGNTALFDPRLYWPHITIAYTVNDLFPENGVQKGYNVCHRPLEKE